MSKYVEKFQSRTPQNRFVFDYLTINFKDTTPDEVLQIFCGVVSNPDVCVDSFIDFDSGSIRSYNRSLRFFGERFITINWRSFDLGTPFTFKHTGAIDKFDTFQGVSLNITGTGCRAMTEQDFYNLFALLKGYNVSYTRLDVAFDDFNQVMPADNMIASINDWFHGKDNAISTRSRRVTSRIYLNNASINGFNFTSENFDLGSNGSSQKLRMYDKRVEQSRDDVDYWKRLEFMLRHDKATNFINDYLQCKNIVVCYVKYLSDILRFLADGKNLIRSQIKNAPWWEQFLRQLEEYTLQAIYI